MENLLQEQIAPPLQKSVKVKQIIAATIIVIGLLIFDICTLLWSPTHIYRLLHILILFNQFGFIIGLIILSTIAANRPTKRMTYTLLGLSILDLTLSWVPMHYILYIFLIAIPIGKIYAYSVIIKNNYIPENTIKWINILCIGIILPTFRQLSLHLMGYNIIQDFLSYNNNFCYEGFKYLFMILLIISYFKFCRCAAFNGNHDTSSSATEYYYPINKYTVSLVVTTIIMLVTIVIYDKLIVPELM